MSTPERGITKQDERRPDGQAIQREDMRASLQDTAASRGTDERRETVNPAHNPAPRSPEPDREAVERSEATLDRVKAY